MDQSSIGIGFLARFRYSSGELEEASGILAELDGCVAASCGPVAPEELVDLYRDRGLSFGDQACDETSFVLWDPGSATLVAGRDRRGFRPLYARREPDGWSFATSVKSLRPRRLDPSGVSRHLAGLPSPVETCFAGIEGLPPSSYMVITERGVALRKYAVRVERSDDLRMTLEDAVRRRMPEGPFACALSGGVDSALVLSMAGKRARAYTLAPRDANYSEVDAARGTAAWLGVDLHLVEADEKRLVEALPDAVEAAEMPLFNLHAVAKFLLARAVRADGLSVLLGGEGADELLGEAPPGESYLDTVFPVAVLQMLHGVCAANGVEARLPFLDRRLGGLTAEERRGKAALRALLPPEIANRPKRPRVASPVDFFAPYLTEERFRRVPYLRVDEARRLYDRYRAAPTDPALDGAMMRIVTLLILAERCVA